MRILGGYLKGHVLEQPKSNNVRPLSQKARAAIFDVLGDIAGLSVLDLYAGSGAAGLEAISRGASRVLLIEQHPQVAAVIRRNIETLGLSNQAQVTIRAVETWLDSNQKAKFDLVIADPPYADLDQDVLEQIATVLSPAGILVVSQTSKIEPFKLQSLKLVKTKVYGDTALSFYKR